MEGKSLLEKARCKKVKVT